MTGKRWTKPLHPLITPLPHHRCIQHLPPPHDDAVTASLASVPISSSITHTHGPRPVFSLTIDVCVSVWRLSAVTAGSYWSWRRGCGCCAEWLAPSLADHCTRTHDVTHIHTSACTYMTAPAVRCYPHDISTALSLSVRPSVSTLASPWHIYSSQLVCPSVCQYLGITMTHVQLWVYLFIRQCYPHDISTVPHNTLILMTLSLSVCLSVFRCTNRRYSHLIMQEAPATTMCVLILCELTHVHAPLFLLYPPSPTFLTELCEILMCECVCESTHMWAISSPPPPYFWTELC